MTRARLLILAGVVLLGAPGAAQSYFDIEPPGLHVLSPPGVTPVVAGDYDGDGYPDLAAWSQFTLHCYPGVPGASFGTPVTTTLANGNASTTVRRLIGPADLNGDGLDDLIRGGAWGTIPLLSQGNGTFVEGLGPPYIVSARTAGFADLDGNGSLEFVYPELYANGQGTAVSVAVLDVPTSTLVVQWTLATPPLTGTRTGDFNADGSMDILLFAMGTAGEMVFRVLLGNGLGSAFTLTAPLPMLSAVGGPDVVTPMVGDVNGDGADDVLATTMTIGQYSLHLGVPAGVGGSVLAAPSVVPIAWPSCSATGGHRQRVADIDADGYADLLIVGCQAAGLGGNASPLGLRIHRSLGDGTFRPPYMTELIPSTDYDYGPSTFDLVDVDGDGDLEVAYQNVSWFTFDVWSGFANNRAILGPGTGSTGGGLAPRQQLTPLAPGGTLSASLLGALPGVTAVAGLSLGGTRATPSVPGPLWIDPAPGMLIWPDPTFGTFTTDAAGQVTITASIPPAFPAGVTLYSQWISQDPGGGASLYGGAWVVSEGRTLIFF